MEKYEWFCPRCGRYNSTYISEYNAQKCKGCNEEAVVKSNGEVVNRWSR
jgi:DNA-directed RNA polymerase subunit RPC12/RpoP